MPVIFFGLPLATKHAIEHLRIRDEVGRLGAFLGSVDIRNHDVCLSARQCRQQRRESHSLVGQLETQAFADLLAQIDVETDVFIWVFRIDRFIAWCVGIDRVDQRLALPLRIFGLQRGTSGGRGGRSMARKAKHQKARKAG